MYGHSRDVDIYSSKASKVQSINIMSKWKLKTLQDYSKRSNSTNVDLSSTFNTKKLLLEPWFIFSTISKIYISNNGNTLQERAIIKRQSGLSIPSNNNSFKVAGSIILTSLRLENDSIYACTHIGLELLELCNDNLNLPIDWQSRNAGSEL